MRTLQLTTPLTHGEDVKQLQTLLRKGGWKGTVDGQYGVSTANEVYRRKVAFGYAKPDHAAGDLLIAYLKGTKKPTAAMLARAKKQPKLKSPTSPPPAKPKSREDKVRAACVSIAHLLVANAGKIHYPPHDVRTRSDIHTISSMEELEAILRSPGGLSADCSQTVSLIAHVAGAKCPDGSYAANWKADGYTGTLLAGMKKIPASAVLPGDIKVYGGGTGHHAVMAVTPGPNPNTVSHGGDPIHFITDSVESQYQPSGGSWLRLPV